jgi:hypothetical protein
VPSNNYQELVRQMKQNAATRPMKAKQVTKAARSRA